MSCGLGAAVLLFLIIKHNTDQVIEVSENISSETNLLAQEIQVGKVNLARIRNSIKDVDDELAEARGLARQIQDEIDALRGQIAALGPSEADEIDRIQQQIQVLENQKETLEDEAKGGNRVRAFVGEGNRQYLTGLHLGGNRALILLDSSSSMLDETIVNIIRRRNRPDDVKRASPKWQQALAIVDWITANLSPGTDFQIYSFNETAKAVLPDTEGEWVNNNDIELMDHVLTRARETVPDKGTNLLEAVRVIHKLRPPPDNVFLITDGLPTQGKAASNKSSVSAAERLRYFNDAFDEIPREIPINTLLLPMEGDFYAAAAFWRLTLETRGSFIAPPRDWP